jgi:hypothetical protein
MLLRFLLRDSIILALSLSLWQLFAPRSAGADFIADFTGWVVGSMLGVCAYLAHEWSHYLGAVVMRSKVRVGENLASGFLFSFDSESNRLSQFVVMSLAGFAATALVVLAYYTWLPDAYLASRVARGGALFLAFLGVVLELPLLLAGVITRGVPKQVSV